MSSIFIPFENISADDITQDNSITESNNTYQNHQTEVNNVVEPANRCGLEGCTPNLAADACTARAMGDNVLLTGTAATIAAFYAHIQNRAYVQAANFAASNMRNLSFAYVMGQITYFSAQCTINPNYA